MKNGTADDGVVIVHKKGVIKCECGSTTFIATIKTYPDGERDAELHCKKCGKEIVDGKL